MAVLNFLEVLLFVYMHFFFWLQSFALQSSLTRGFVKTMNKDTQEIVLEPLSWALVSYYAHKKGQSCADMVQWMIELYAAADKNIDLHQFADFVQNKLLSELSNRSDRERLRRQVAQYVKQREMSEETTASGPQKIWKKR